MPDWKPHIRPRLASLRLSSSRENDIIEELSQHLEDRWRELVAGGASEDEATKLALAGFRGVDLLAKEMEPLRQAHAPTPIAPGVPTAPSIDGLMKDLGYVVRGLRKQPAFAIVATLMLALGIGANIAIFSVVYGVLLKPLPFEQPDRLVAVSHRAPGVKLAAVEQSPATYFTYRDHNRVFEDFGAWDSAQVSITGSGDPERVEALMVTDGTLPLLRVQPLRGRLFRQEDNRPDGPSRVILTYNYWQRQFGGAENVLGRVLRIDDTPREIVGVLPRTFKFLRTDPAVVLPMQLDRTNVWVVFQFQGVARLKADVTLTQANADVSRMLPLLIGWVPGFSEWQLQPNVHPLAEEVVGDVGPTLWIVLATVGVVLLIACANVANLFLVRVEGRQNEFAVRAALGANRVRMARLLLAESLTLALGGGILGLMLARFGIAVLKIYAPSTMPRVDEIGIDSVVVLYTLALSVVAGLIVGVAAVMRLATPNLAVLSEGGRSMTDGAVRNRTRNGLIVAEIALSLVLLVASGLMVRTFVSLGRVDPGFIHPRQVQTFRIALTSNRVDDPRTAARLHEQIAERLQAVPGVSGVGLSSSVTMGGDTNGNPTIVEHVPVTKGAAPLLRRFKYVGAGYVETMGNRLVAGRHITWTDVQHARPSVMISENLAREYWSRPSDAIGKRLTNGAGLPWREIVGAAMGLTPLMSTLLFGVAALDPLTYLLVSSLLACVAILATYLAARRVARIDPVVALRSEL